MKRIILGWVFIVHALAHAALGVWISGDGPPFLVTLVWVAALVGFMATGLGLLRVPVLRQVWKPILAIAALSSVLLCTAFGEWFGLLGLAVNVVLFIVAGEVMQRRIDADVDAAEALGAEISRHPRWLRAGWITGVAALGYVAAVAVVRPLYLRWGTTTEERGAALAGDEVLAKDARYRVDHGITIHAPARAVWPWLVQLGQDRGGFYSYDWLERAFGVAIRNADSIHPEWQNRAVGDTIYATQPTYFGGKLGALGWRVSAIEPQRAIVLEKWGAFVLRPIDSNTTRLIVRTREPGTIGVAGLVFSPFGVFVFEPAHFIMQRGMLRGIRDRAERAARAPIVMH